jgi:hypothetical protein
VEYGTVALWPRALWGRAASPLETHDTPADSIRRELDMTNRQSTIALPLLLVCENRIAIVLNYKPSSYRRTA